MIMYFDVETTGLCPIKHGIVQLAAIFVQDGEEKARVDIKINPVTFDGKNHTAYINIVELPRAVQVQGTDGTSGDDLLDECYAKLYAIMTKEDK